jgi:tetratricopeptide (TPR) repeat protein
MIQTELRSVKAGSPASRHPDGQHHALRASTKAPVAPSHTASLTKKSGSPYNTQEGLFLKKNAKSPFETTLEDIKGLKDQGDICFSHKEYKDAATNYRNSFELLVEASELFPHEHIDKSLKIKLLANVSHCLLKMGEFEESLDFNLQILKFDREYIKAYYRASVALNSLGREEEAVEILRQGMPFVKPSNDLKTKEMYLELYTATNEAFNRGVEEMREKVKDLIESDLQSTEPQVVSSFVFDRSSILWAISSATLMSGPWLLKGARRGFTGWWILAGNSLGCSLMTASHSYKHKAICLGSLLLFNYLIFKFRK